MKALNLYGKGDIVKNIEELENSWTRSQRFYIKYVKTMLDIFFALILLIILSPLFLIISIAIKLDSKGPVFFRQKRVGKDCQIFSLMKFRSMEVSSDTKVDAAKDIKRITKSGRILRRTSIDELPQLLNIISGKMSFIGPRPLLIEYIPRYTPEQMKRHYVKQGISGLSQVSGRNSMKWDEKFILDVEYVKNISFMLDLRIFLKTISVLIRGKGINNSMEVTMPLFNNSKR
jgi:lipopolysaccharide/colanic/teichoic acid biosynthesis glycosyltransferase